MSEIALSEWHDRFARSLTFAAYERDRDVSHTAAERDAVAEDISRDVATSTSATSISAAAASGVAPAIAGIPIAELVSRIQAGDETAFRILYTDRFRTLWRIAMLQTRSAAIAEDVVQDVFVNVWTHPETIQGDRDIRVYLAAAVRNRSRDVAKHRRVTEAAARTLHDAPVRPPVVSHPLPATDAAAESEDFFAAYLDALTLLSEQERLAALLRWEEGMTFEQIGEVLSMSSMGARKVVLRAQQKVQASLAPYRDE